MGRKWWIWCKCICHFACTDGNYYEVGKQFCAWKLCSLPSWNLNEKSFRFFHFPFHRIRRKRFFFLKKVKLLHCRCIDYHKSTLVAIVCMVLLPATGKCPQLVQNAIRHDMHMYMQCQTIYTRWNGIAMRHQTANQKTILQSTTWKRAHSGCDTETAAEMGRVAIARDCIWIER